MFVSTQIISHVMAVAFTRVVYAQETVHHQILTIVIVNVSALKYPVTKCVLITGGTAKTITKNWSVNAYTNSTKLGNRNVLS